MQCSQDSEIPGHCTGTQILWELLSEVYPEESGCVLPQKIQEPCWKIAICDSTSHLTFGIALSQLVSTQNDKHILLVQGCNFDLFHIILPHYFPGLGSYGLWCSYTTGTQCMHVNYSAVKIHQYTLVSFWCKNIASEAIFEHLICKICLRERLEKG